MSNDILSIALIIHTRSTCTIFCASDVVDTWTDIECKTIQSLCCVFMYVLVVCVSPLRLAGQCSWKEPSPVVSYSLPGSHLTI